jgi:hypothetical protein
VIAGANAQLVGVVSTVALSVPVGTMEIGA